MSTRTHRLSFRASPSRQIHLDPLRCLSETEREFPRLNRKERWHMTRTEALEQLTKIAADASLSIQFADSMRKEAKTLQDRCLPPYETDFGIEVEQLCRDIASGMMTLEEIQKDARQLRDALNTF